MKYLLLIWVSISSITLFAQEEKFPKSFVELNVLIEPNEPSYGFQSSYQHQIFKRGKFYGFSAGLHGLLLTN